MRTAWVCACVLLAAGSAMEGEQEFVTIVQACGEMHKITEEEMEGLHNVVVPESEEGKCFVGCVLEGMGVVQDGRFSKESAQVHAKNKMADKPEELDKHLQLIDRCHEEVAGHADKCETGPRLMECIKSHAPGLGIILPGSDA